MQRVEIEWGFGRFGMEVAIIVKMKMGDGFKKRDAAEMNMDDR